MFFIFKNWTYNITREFSFDAGAAVKLGVYDPGRIE